ncbi:MAG TPA: ERAP1-like C-terminal domain-containing protein, partial [Gemmatimonadales bacterium]
VAGARGLPAPRFVYANADDYGYALVRLDPASLAALQNGAIGRVADPFLRAMLWGTLWDEVRAARMDPARYIRLAMSELPTETDEQIVPRVLGRLRRAMSAYLSDVARARLQSEVETFLHDGAANARHPYGIRKAYLDASIGLATSPAGIAQVDSILDRDSVAGDLLRDPTRWDIVDQLLSRGGPSAERRLVAQRNRDRTPDGRRRTFVAGVAAPDSAAKRDYFARYFADANLNEDWASGSLGAFNALEHQALTRRYLRPALDSLPFIQANRRIFFLGGWLAAFMNGQSSQQALDIVRQFLDQRQDLPADLRRKVLENVDELERTVAIRKRWN